MMRVFLYATGFLLLATSGVLHGLLINRWGSSGELKAAVARCEDVAMNVGDWEAQATTLDARQLAVADIGGHMSRRYTNRITKQTVTVLLLCGRPGPLAVHTPDVCYRSSGYEVVGNPAKRLCGSSEAGPAEFWTAPFKKPGVAPEPLRIFWAWNDGKAWTASENPRWSFARSAYLYKLYVMHSLSSTDEPLDEDLCLEFLQVLVPELQRRLFPPSDAAKALGKSLSSPLGES